MVAQLLRLQPPQQPLSTEPLPGQHLTHHPVHLGPGDPGHPFPPKPVAGSIGTLRPAGTGPHGDATRPRCGSRTRPAQRRSSRSRTPSRCASGTLPRKPVSPRVCTREHGRLQHPPDLVLHRHPNRLAGGRRLVERCFRIEGGRRDHCLAIDHQGHGRHRGLLRLRTVPGRAGRDSCGNQHYYRQQYEAYRLRHGFPVYSPSNRGRCGYSHSCFPPPASGHPRTGCQKRPLDPPAGMHLRPPPAIKVTDNYYCDNPV